MIKSIEDIDTEEKYEEVLREVERLMDIEPQERVKEEKERLSQLIDILVAYEKEHYQL